MPEKPLQVRLEQTDQRSGRYTLTFDTSQYSVTLNLEVNIIFNEWLRRLRPVLAGGRDPSGELTQDELLRNVGRWLWQALLPESAPTQEREALAHLLRTGHTPLLLELPDTLSGLPWELLYDPQFSDERGFLARCRPLMRLSTSTTAVIPLELPLRVLLLISSPPELGVNSRVDVESERAAVERAIRGMRKAGFIYLLVEDIVTPKRVQRLLDSFKPHIVHYIGHGEYDETKGGMVLWEDDHGNELPFSAESLADLLRPLNLHVIIFHACQSGRSNTRTDALSLAGTLAHKGLPAILAQQANFSYESSLLASEAWYTALIGGKSLVDALFEVRQALSQADRPDWAVPILQGDTTSLRPVLAITSIPGSPDPLLSSVGAAADLPTLTDSFVGRHRELRTLCLMLENTSGSGPVLALITGPGGMGKTTLAAQAVSRYGRAYKAALTLLCERDQIDRVDIFLQSIGEFLKRLGTPSFLEHCLPDPKLSTEEKIEKAIVALNVVGPVLLVIHNLERVQNDDHTISDKALLYLLQTLLTNLRGGRVLITGRYTVKDLLPHVKFAANLRYLDLDDLSPYETNQLLMRHPPLAQLSEFVRQMLVREFGGFPYVYDLLRSKAAVEDLEQIIYEVREYGPVMQKTITQEHKQRTTEEWQKVHHEVVAFATVEVIINRLSEASRTLLGQLGVLHRPFPLAAIKQGLGVAYAEWQPLLDWSLLHYDPHKETYHLHSLTRRYAEDLLDEQARVQTQAQLAAWYEHYAVRESHDLTDSLEAYRLWRAAGNLRQAGELVIHLAEVLRRFGLYPLLRELCTTTLGDIRESDELLAAQFLNELGNIAYLQGEYEEARRLYQECLEINERLGGQDGRAGTLHQLGNIALQQGNYEEARRLYEQNLKINERLGDQDGRAGTLHQLGMIAMRQGNYEEARQLSEQSLKIFKRLGDQKGQAVSLQQLGTIAQDQGDYKGARRLYEQNLKIFERLGDQDGRANSLGLLGVLAYNQEDFEHALMYTVQAYILLDALRSPACAFAQDMLTRIRSHMDEATFTACWQTEARRLYEQNLKIFERLGDQRGQAGTLNQLGMIALQQGDYKGARQLYEQSLKINERLGDQDERAGILHELGMIAMRQGNYEEARRLYGQNLEMSERLGDQRGQASTLHQLGLLAYAQGDFEHALTYTVQAYTLFDSLQSPSRDIALLMIARIRSQMNEATFTARWRTVTDGRPLPPLPDDDTKQRQIRVVIAPQVVFDFIQAPTSGESKRILEAHLELLQPEVDALLQQLAAHQKQEGARKTIEEHRLLLADCRDKGIEGAFAEHRDA